MGANMPHNLAPFIAMWLDAVHHTATHHRRSPIEGDPMKLIVARLRIIVQQCPRANTVGRSPTDAFRPVAAQLGLR